MSSAEQLNIVLDCIKSCIKLVDEKKNESVIRHNFSSYLRLIYPDSPSWVNRHIENSETLVKLEDSKKSKIGFVDSLIDLTAIEYESNLSNKSKFQEGFSQVQKYCLSLVNEGHPSDLIIGILSDTVRWYAYRISDHSAGINSINLELIESIDLSSANTNAAKNLLFFLDKYLGRIGARPLNASSIALDFGFNSIYARSHIASLNMVVNKAFDEKAEYADLIQELWCKFINYIRDKDLVVKFDIKGYTDEFYILTFAKLVFANVISQKALISDVQQIKDILNGNFFTSKGLRNFIEYDYFGWINSDPYLSLLAPVAQDIQSDLLAYNFKIPPSEDLFGKLFVELAKRTKRLLLGQEWTPAWLANFLVEKAIASIPNGENLRLLDMCCGSGSIIVEAIKSAKKHIEKTRTHLQKKEQIFELTSSITGFDIDPLAVMLSKISWLLAAGDWLQPYGKYSIDIPVYHADSLFAITPVSKVDNDNSDEFHQLKIADHILRLPSFLVTPAYQPIFDSILDLGYKWGVDSSNISELNQNLFENFLENEFNKFNEIEVTNDQSKKIADFSFQLTKIIQKLHQEGLNGVWAFILRNSYRPGLVGAQFNGIVANPPWLTLSKIADNPYKEVLVEKAEKYCIKPSGSSFLHVDLSSIFLLHAIDKYLIEGASVACILPDSILNGAHHEPLRSGQYVKSERNIKLNINELWKIEESTFKNKAVVLIGNKSEFIAKNKVPGGLLKSDQIESFDFYKYSKEKRTAWSSDENSIKIENKLLTDYAKKFKQGADVMPRTLFFFEVTPCAHENSETQLFTIESINVLNSDKAFLIKDAKKMKNYKLQKHLVPKNLLFDVLISQQLTPFHMAESNKAFLPIKKDRNSEWNVISQYDFASCESSSQRAIQSIIQGLGNDRTLNDIWNLLNTRKKLSQQKIENDKYLILSGAGGANICSAFIKIKNVDMIIDQTLYWSMVDTENEALYIVGLLNSEAMNHKIKNFQPEGSFGKRHIHSLPFGFIPVFNDEDLSHLEISKITLKLICEYNEQIELDDEVKKLLNPNFFKLAQRRSRLSRIIKKLPSYEKYENLCEDLIEKSN